MKTRKNLKQQPLAIALLSGAGVTAEGCATKRRNLHTAARFAGSICGLLLLLTAGAAGAREPEASWDNHCEHCHGDHVEFARKYLWNVDGKLQGRHHIDDLHLFMQNHYLPAHEIESLGAMLLAQANSPLRFEHECGSCHGEVAAFVEQSIWVRGDSMTALKSGLEVSEFLPTHQGLEPETIEFYLRLFARVAQ